MKKLLPTVLVAVLLASSAPAQWLETRIWLIDSLCLREVTYMAANDSGNSLYMAGGEWGEFIDVLDGASHARVARIATGGHNWGLCWNSTDNKLYSGHGDEGESLSVIDCATNQVLRRRKMCGHYPGRMLYVPVTNKLYVSVTAGVGILDAAADTWVGGASMDNDGGPATYDPVTGKVFCADANAPVCVAIDPLGDSAVARIDVGEAPHAVTYNSRDGKLYCANSGDDDITVIDGVGDTVVARIQTRSGPAGLAYNPVENRVYCSVSGDSSVIVIDGASNQVTDTVRVGAEPRYLLFEPAHNRVYCSNGDGTVSVIDGSTNQVVATDTVPPGPFTHLASAGTVYTNGGGTVGAIACATGQVDTLLIVNCVTSKALYDAQSDKVFVASGHTNDITVIDPGSNEVTNRVKVRDWPLALTHNWTSDWLYCNIASNAVRVVAAGNDSTIASIPVGPDPQRAVYNPTHNKVYCANFDSGGVSVIDGATNQVITTIATGASPRELIYNATSGKVYCADWSGGFVTVIDGASNAVLCSTAVGMYPRALAHNPRVNKVYCANMASGDLTVVDGVTNQRLRTVAIGGNPSCLACDSLGNRLYVGNAGDGTVSVLDCGSDSVIASIAVGGVVNTAMYDETGNRVFVCNTTEFVAIDATTNQVVGRIQTGLWNWEEDPASRMAISPQHDRLYIAGGDLWVTVIRLSSGVAEPRVPAPDRAGFSLEPTLSRGRLRLRMPRESGCAQSTLVFRDAAGLTVKRILVPAGVVTIDCHTLPSGVYFVSLEGRPETRTKVVLSR